MTPFRSDRFLIRSHGGNSTFIGSERKQTVKSIILCLVKISSRNVYSNIEILNTCVPHNRAVEYIKQNLIEMGVMSLRMMEKGAPQFHPSTEATIKLPNGQNQLFRNSGI